MRRLTVPAGAAVAALLLVACGGSSKEAPTRTAAAGRAAPPLTPAAGQRPQPPSPAAIVSAATRTAAEPGFRADLRARIGLPRLGGNALTASGHGRFDPGSGSGALNLTIGLPGLLSLAGPVPARVVLSGSEAYVSIPRDIAREAGTPASWLEVGTEQLGLGGSLTPADILREVARDATTHVPGQRATVTIDRASGLVRTIFLSYSVAGGYHVQIRLRFTGFGPEPASQAPPAGATGSLASVLARLGF